MSKKRVHEDGEFFFTREIKTTRIRENDKKITILKKEIKDLEEKHSSIRDKYVALENKIDKIIDLLQECRLEAGLKKLDLKEECSYIS